jgi:uncharacterized protein (TIGR00299 family) protein
MNDRHDDHAHEHPHTHSRHASHRHAHEHGAHRGDHASEQDPEEHRTPLSRGAGRGKILHLDAFSGIAGDMTIAALVDLGVPLSVVRESVDALGLEGVQLALTTRFAGAIGASHFDVLVSGSHPERRYGEIDSLIEAAGLPADVSGLARDIFRTLAEAEARVHRIAVEDVHFHEVGAVDAIVDVVGAAAAFAFLGANVVCAPLPLGRGSVECRHGVLPLPAPATVECLLGVPTYDAGIEAELVTPTGAAIARAVPVRYESWPSMSPERVGWGRGSRDLPDRPNALRVVLGQPVGAGTALESGTHVIVEATIDDMTGELAAHAAAALMESGALDVWIAAATMKKGRPGMVISAIAPLEAEHPVAETMLRTTTTIGVRVHRVSRIERPRSLVDVSTPYGVVPVKISGGGFGPDRFKPEFDVCATLAQKAGVPVQVVLDAAHAAAKRR